MGGLKRAANRVQRGIKESQHQRNAPMNMTAGCMLPAILNSMRTSFSDSPCHRDVSDDAEILKNVA
jgi:hypothetical protein